jgi:hypothetical protein
MPIDLSPEEIQRKLHELLEENLHLKGSLEIQICDVLSVDESEEIVLKVVCASLRTDHGFCGNSIAVYDKIM